MSGILLHAKVLYSFLKAFFLEVRNKIFSNTFQSKLENSSDRINVSGLTPRVDFSEKQMCIPWKRQRTDKIFFAENLYKNAERFTLSLNVQAYNSRFVWLAWKCIVFRIDESRHWNFSKVKYGLQTVSNFLSAHSQTKFIFQSTRNLQTSPFVQWRYFCAILINGLWKWSKESSNGSYSCTTCRVSEYSGLRYFHSFSSCEKISQENKSTRVDKTILLLTWIRCSLFIQHGGDKSQIVVMFRTSCHTLKTFLYKALIRPSLRFFEYKDKMPLYISCLSVVYEFRKRCTKSFQLC